MTLLESYHWVYASEKIWKSVNIWWSCGQEFSFLFFLTRDVDVEQAIFAAGCSMKVQCTGHQSPHCSTWLYVLGIYSVMSNDEPYALSLIVSLSAATLRRSRRDQMYGAAFIGSIRRTLIMALPAQTRLWLGYCILSEWLIQSTDVMNHVNYCC